MVVDRDVSVVSELDILVVRGCRVVYADLAHTVPNSDGLIPGRGEARHLVIGDRYAHSPAAVTPERNRGSGGIQFKSISAGAGRRRRQGSTQRGCVNNAPGIVGNTEARTVRAMQQVIQIEAG